jgi:hypothetical protein
MTRVGGQCRNEGLPSSLGEIDGGGDDANATDEPCWTHRRRGLAQGDFAPGLLVGG